MSKEYYVIGYKNEYASGSLGRSGPFSSRGAAERFAAGLAESGKVVSVTIIEEQADDEDSES